MQCEVRCRAGVRPLPRPSAEVYGRLEAGLMSAIDSSPASAGVSAADAADVSGVVLPAAGRAFPQRCPDMLRIPVSRTR